MLFPVLKGRRKRKLNPLQKLEGLSFHISALMPFPRIFIPNYFRHYMEVEHWHTKAKSRGGVGGELEK